MTDDDVRKFLEGNKQLMQDLAVQERIGEIEQSRPRLPYRLRNLLLLTVIAFVLGYIFG